MLELLRSAIGADAITADPRDFALHGVAPGRVVEPRSSEEAAAVLKLAAENEWRVECAGGGSQAFGNRRTRADLVISTRRLTGILEYEPDDLVIGIHAGTTLDALHAETGRRGQFYAQDPAAGTSSTIGGVLATARSGPLRFSQGTPRDHALGLEVVTGDGRILNVGGRVVKNVAGYDLVRLLVGSAGTLALITSAHLRLKPAPLADETIAVKADSAEPLLELADFIINETLEAGALELLGPGLLADAWTLVIRLMGNRESVHDARSRIALRSVHAEPAPPGVWRTLADAELNALTMVRLADLPTRLPVLLQLAEKLRVRAAAPTLMAAHAGDGIVRMYFAEADAESLAFAIGEARAVVGVSGGTVLAHSRDGELMRRVDSFGSLGGVQTLNGRLKQIFDPAGVFAPGRFIM